MNRVSHKIDLVQSRLIGLSILALLTSCSGESEDANGVKQVSDAASQLLPAAYSLRQDPHPAVNELAQHVTDSSERCVGFGVVKGGSWRYYANINLAAGTAVSSTDAPYPHPRFYSVKRGDLGMEFELSEGNAPDLENIRLDTICKTDNGDLTQFGRGGAFNWTILCEDQNDSAERKEEINWIKAFFPPHLRV